MTTKRQRDPTSQSEKSCTTTQSPPSRAAPIATWVNPLLSRLARCSGEFIHNLTTSLALTLPLAMFSPAVVAWQLVRNGPSDWCVNVCVAARWAAHFVASELRQLVTVRGRRPCAVRWALVAVTTSAWYCAAVLRGAKVSTGAAPLAV